MQGVNREKGPAKKVWLNEPIGLFFDDHAGVLYIGDTFNARIRAVCLEGSWVAKAMYEAKGERGARFAKQSMPLYSSRCLEEEFSEARCLEP
jgi:hypothetical protein